MNDDLTEFEFNPSNPPRGWRKWMAKVLVKKSDGELYIPAGIAPCGEMAAMMSAS
jgi:hypothetical protein